MRILLFGANGQVGREFCALRGGHDVIAVTRQEADLTTAGAAELLIKDVNPDAIINASAYTAVDKAEDQPDLAMAINAYAVSEISLSARNAGAAFVHISTDYVFDGKATEPYQEHDNTRPLGVYGETKYAGEIAALEKNPDAFVLRTSWVYSAYGNNFVKTMLRLAGDRDELTIVDDQVGGPTPAAAIAAAALKVVESPIRDTHGGVYHFQGAPAVSWAGFAESIFEAAKAPTRVIKIPTSAYPTSAMRPLYTVLDCSRILRDFGIEQPDWRSDVKSLVAQLIAQAKE